MRTTESRKKRRRHCSVFAAAATLGAPAAHAHETGAAHVDLPFDLGALSGIGVLGVVVAAVLVGLGLLVVRINRQ